VGNGTSLRKLGTVAYVASLLTMEMLVFARDVPLRHRTHQAKTISFARQHIPARPSKGLLEFLGQKSLLAIGNDRGPTRRRTGSTQYRSRTPSHVLPVVSPLFAHTHSQTYSLNGKQPQDCGRPQLPAFSDAMATSVMRSQIARHATLDAKRRSWSSRVRAAVARVRDAVARVFNKLKSIVRM
jgi:hypothetical protein